MREAEALEEAAKRAQKYANAQGRRFAVVRDASFGGLTSQPGTYPFRVIGEREREKFGFSGALQWFDPEV